MERKLSHEQSSLHEAHEDNVRVLLSGHEKKDTKADLQSCSAELNLLACDDLPHQSELQCMIYHTVPIFEPL